MSNAITLFQDPNTGDYFQKVSGPAGLVPVYPQSVMPWQQPGQPAQQQQQGGDFNSQLLASLLPLLTTLPGITNTQAAQAALKTELDAITPPADLLANPTAADFNALKTYSAQVANALKKSVGNNSLILATMRQQVMFQVIVPMMTGGNSNGSMLAFVMMFAMGGLV
jgi:hypothetical protein